MDIVVQADGWLIAGTARYHCTVGKSGIVRDKREGDGATPAGKFPVRSVFYRADRLDKPETMLPCWPIHHDDGWCDDPGHADYNRPVRLPHPGRHERLWREDGLYDVLAVIGYNDDPVVPGAGSCIFMHIARPAWTPTEGCVALTLDDLRSVLRACGPQPTLTVVPA